VGLFFEGKINAERYQNLLTNFIYLLEENERDSWLQHDRMTAHTANTTALLQEFFGERIAALGFWPLRSPDLTRQTSLRGNLSTREFIQITDEAWRN
jgi:hypothetical protein